MVALIKLVSSEILETSICVYLDRDGCLEFERLLPVLVDVILSTCVDLSMCSDIFKGSV